MYRVRYHQKLRSAESRNDYLRLSEQLNELARQRGWREATFWTPTVGSFNEIVVELEYPDLATFERESRALFADADAADLLLRFGELVDQGWGHSELWEQASAIAS